MVEITAEAYVYCNDCKKPLVVADVSNNEDIFVEPCAKCIDEAMEKEGK